MMQRVRDDIDSRVEQSNAMVDARVHASGAILPAKMKKDDRPVYVIAGNLVQYDDGSGIDTASQTTTPSLVAACLYRPLIIATLKHFTLIFLPFYFLYFLVKEI